MRIISKIKSIIESKKFLIAVIILFIVQGAFFAVSINAGERYINENGIEVIAPVVAPDEHRHIGNIEYYANRSIFAGPIINDAQPADLWLGEVERFPSYLYYYLMSLPVKVAYYMGASEHLVTFGLRMVGVLIGAFGLFLFYRILREVKFNKFVSSLATFGLSITGMYVWISAAVSYDIPAVVLFFLFLLFAVKGAVRNNPLYFVPMITTFFLLAITKYTYIPIGAIGTAVALGIYLWKNKKPLQQMKERLQGYYKKHTIASILIFILLILSFGLFTERIGGNLLQYQSFNPLCDKIHAPEDCMNFSIYERNTTQEAEYSAQREAGFAIPYHPLSHIGLWADAYYGSMYFYAAHMKIPLKSPLLILSGALAVLLLIVLGFRNRTKLLASTAQWYVMGLALAYTLMTYAFNVKTYLNMGMLFAYQGRYLLVAVGFFYAVAVLLLLRQWQSLTAQQKKFIGLPVILFLVLVVILHSTPVSFFLHAHEEWYTDIMRKAFYL